MQLFKLSPPILELSTLKNISVEIFCFSEICFIFKLSFKVEDICSWASQVAQLKNPPANAGEMGSIPRSGRSPGEGNGNPLQCSCLENPMDRGAWWGYSSWGHLRVRLDWLIDWAGIFVLTREYDCILQKQPITGYGRNKRVKSWGVREEPSGRFCWKELWDLNVLLQGQQTP